MILCPSCGTVVENRYVREFVDLDTCRCSRLIVANDIWRYSLSRCTFEYVDGWEGVIFDGPFQDGVRVIPCEDFRSFFEEGEFSVWTVLQS